MSSHPTAARVKESLSKRAEAAHYIADMTKELRDLAQFAGFDLLAHILDMASEEAIVQSDCRRSSDFNFEA